MRSRTRFFILAFLALAGVAGWLWSRQSWPIRNLSPRPGPVVVLGDSLAAGVGSQSGQGYVGLLSQRLGIEIVNRGVPGDTTARGLERLETDVVALKPALVIVELGGNDFLQRLDPEETFANLREIVTRCQDAGAAVLLVGVQSGLFGDRLEKRYRDLARTTGCGYVPNVLQDILRSPALKHDAIHPNDAGYARMAERIEPELRRMLKRMARLQ